MKLETKDRLDRMLHNPLEASAEAIVDELLDQGYSEMEIRKYFQAKYADMLKIITEKVA